MSLIKLRRIYKSCDLKRAVDKLLLKKKFCLFKSVANTVNCIVRKCQLCKRELKKSCVDMRDKLFIQEMHLFSPCIASVSGEGD